MQASVRILWVVAIGVALAVMLVAGAPAAMAYDDTATSPHLINAVHPLVNFSSGHASYEDGPVELPHPVDTTPGTFSAPSSMTSTMPAAPTTGKLESAGPSGAMPGARGAGPITDSATRAERSIRQVIRKLG